MMGDECCKEVCEGIQFIKTVKALNLSKNSITDTGAPHVAEMLNNSWTVLTSLIIHWNQIRGKGAIILAKMLKKNMTL